MAVLGHNPTFAIRGLVGDLSLRAETFEDASVVIRVDASSIQLVDDISERDRREIERNMHREVLETDQFPEIMYVSQRVEVVDGIRSPAVVSLAGDLTIHGETRSQTITAHVTINGGLVRAYGQFSIWQTDYRIQLVTIAGGTLKLKDELKLTFDIAARRLRDQDAED